MTRRQSMYSQLKQVHENLDGVTPDKLQAVLDVIADGRYGYPTGHDPQGHTPVPGHPHDCDCDGCAKPPPYSDRTGELAGQRDIARAEATELSTAVYQMWEASMTVASFMQRLGDRAPVVRWCGSCKRDGGREVLVYSARYQDRCRWCGDARARNDGEDVPLAILRQYHRGGPKSISDQLIAAHPLDNGKLWKRPKR